MGWNRRSKRRILGWWLVTLQRWMEKYREYTGGDMTRGRVIEITDWSNHFTPKNQTILITLAGCRRHVLNKIMAKSTVASTPIN